MSHEPIFMVPYKTAGSTDSGGRKTKSQNTPKKCNKSDPNFIFPIKFQFRIIDIKYFF